MTGLTGTIRLEVAKQLIVEKDGVTTCGAVCSVLALHDKNRTR